MKIKKYGMKSMASSKKNKKIKSMASSKKDKKIKVWHLQKKNVLEMCSFLTCVYSLS